MTSAEDEARPDRGRHAHRRRVCWLSLDNTAAANPPVSGYSCPLCPPGALLRCLGSSRFACCTVVLGSRQFGRCRAQSFDLEKLTMNPISDRTGAVYVWKHGEHAAGPGWSRPCSHGHSLCLHLFSGFKMKIALYSHSIPPAVDGVSRRMTSLLQQLVKQGHEVGNWGQTAWCMVHEQLTLNLCLYCHCCLPHLFASSKVPFYCMATFPP